jgi:transcriptional regulator with XRE-family HTH domain
MSAPQSPRGVVRRHASSAQYAPALRPGALTGIAQLLIPPRQTCPFSRVTIPAKPSFDRDRLMASSASASSCRLGIATTRLREGFGLTRRALAGRARLNEETVAKLERGRSANPSLHTVARVAMGLGVSVITLTDAFVLPPGVSSSQETRSPASPSSVSRRSRGTDLGLVLRAFRTDAGLGVAELQALADMSRMQLSRLEEGRPRPSLLILARIAAALDGSAGDLAAGAWTLGCFAQVYAGEVDPRTAILSRRRGAVGSRRMLNE